MTPDLTLHLDRRLSLKGGHCASGGSILNCRLVGQFYIAGDTLEFIRNISQDEALAISLLGRFAIGRSIFKTKRLEEAGIDFGFLLQMDDLGILHGVQGGDLSGFVLHFNSGASGKFFTPIINRNLVLTVEADDASKELSLECYQISKIGAELLSLGDFNADEAYMREIGAKINTQGFTVRIGQYLSVGFDQGQILNAEEIRS